jgi:hypothetical protein
MVLLDLIRAYPYSEVVLGISFINLHPSAEAKGAENGIASGGGTEVS